MPFIFFWWARISITLTYDMTEEDTGRLLKMAVQRGRRRDKTRGVPSGYVEDFVEPRTKLAAFFSSLLEDFSILTRMHPRLIGKTEGSAVGIAGVVEVDAIVPADGFHCDFKGNGLGV